MGARLDGHPDRKHISRGTKSELDRAVRALERSRDTGQYTWTESDPTLGQWLEHWLQNVPPSTVRWKTLSTYRSQMSVHIVPALGAVRLSSLHAEVLEQRYRRVGKSDPIDARRIAAAVLPLELTALREPRADNGVRAAVRVLVASRDHMSTERTAAVNALTALLRVTDLGIDARAPLTGSQIATVTDWRTRDEDLATATARGEAVRLGKRISTLNEELKMNTRRVTEMVSRSPARDLLEQPGIGPVTAAVTLTAWSHPGRLRSEAAFASLAGVSPVPASSGNTVRHRIKPRRRPSTQPRRAHGHRHSYSHGPPTRAYVERRTSEGRTLKEIRRCLKRYLAHQI